MPPAPGATPSSTPGGERRSILPLVSVPVSFTDGRECSRPFAAPPRSSRADGRHVGGLSPQDSHTGRVPPKLLGDKAVSGPRRPESSSARGNGPAQRPVVGSLRHSSDTVCVSVPQGTGSRSGQAGCEARSAQSLRNHVRRNPAEDTHRVAVRPSDGPHSGDAREVLRMASALAARSFRCLFVLDLSSGRAGR